MNQNYGRQVRIRRDIGDRAMIRAVSGLGSTTRYSLVIDVDVLRLPISEWMVMVYPTTHVVGVSPVDDTNTASA